MATTPISGGSSGGNQLSSTKFALKTEDFINMMVTQLKNQDPMQPTSNQELLQQMSQIGQLQSTTTLQESLKSMVLQNSLGSAGNLIGKSIVGMDSNGEKMTGIVNSVRVEDSEVYLELDSGKSCKLSSVTGITSTASIGQSKKAA